MGDAVVAVALHDWKNSGTKWYFNILRLFLSEITILFILGVWQGVWIEFLFAPLSLSHSVYISLTFLWCGSLFKLLLSYFRIQCNLNIEAFALICIFKALEEIIIIIFIANYKKKASAKSNGVRVNEWTMKWMRLQLSNSYRKFYRKRCLFSFVLLL